MSDLGQMTHGILDNAIDLADVWRNAPWRRDEFGSVELRDIEEAKDRLAELEQFILIYQNRKLRGVA